MRFQRRLRSPLLIISLLIGLSVITVVSVGEGFKVLVNRKDGVTLRKRDGSTITLSLSWKSAFDIGNAKAISPMASGLLGAVTNVAGAILDDGTIIANNVAGEANALEATPLTAAAGLTAGAASATSVMRDLNIAVSQGTGIVGIIVGDATSIVGSMLAGMTGASNIGVLSNLPSPFNTKPAATMSEPQEFLPQSNLHNSSTAAASQQHNITSAPSLNTTVPKPTSTTGSACPPPTTCTLCPLASTKTCTVTETWHMTHYETTATLFSFANVYTVTCTETKTISACPSGACSSLNATLSTLPRPAVIVCANGAFVKREEDCPLPNYDYNSTAPSPTHPCPNTGYTCSECPDGYFCPPQQTPAQSCPCGSGWACGHCSQSWFCAPDPTNSSGNGLLNSVASLLSTTSTSPGEQASPTITKAATLKPNIPNISAAAGALGLSSLSSTVGAQPVASLPELKAAIPAISQVNGAPGSAVGSNMFNSVIGELISVLGKANGLPGDLMAQVTAALGSVTVASGNVFPTVATAGQSLVTVPLPIPTVAKEFKAPPDDGFRELTTTIKSIATVLPVVVMAANGLPTTVPVVEMLVGGAPTKMPMINDPPGLLDGANAGGLKVRRRGARKEEG